LTVIVETGSLLFSEQQKKIIVINNIDIFFIFIVLI